MIVPTTFAMENQTASDISVNDDDVLASEYYFDAGIDNDNGNGTDSTIKKITVIQME